MRKLIGIVLLILLLSTFVTYGVEVSFKDVSENDWYFQSLAYMVEKGIVSGYPDGTFKPNNNLKFEEFVKMVMVAVSGESIEVSEGAFWYENYVSAALESNYITEVMLLNIGKNIDRGTMAEILYRVISKVENLENFSSDELNYIASTLIDLSTKDTNILTIAGLGIICGYPDGTFKSTNMLTRSETVAVINRLVDETKRIPVVFTEKKVIDSRTLEDLPKVDLSHLYKYPTLLGDTVQAENDWNWKNVNVPDIVEDAIEYMSLMHNRDYRTFNKERKQFEQEVLPYLNAYKEYKGVKYNQGLKSYYLEDAKDRQDVIDYILSLDTWIEDFFDVWAEDTMNNKVIVESKFYTSENLLIKANRVRAARGTLRIKYTSHDNPNNIKYELDLVESDMQKRGENASKLGEGAYKIYLDFKNIPSFEVGKWYEIDLDLVMANVARAKGLEDTSAYRYEYIYPIAIRELN